MATDLGTLARCRFLTAPIRGRDRLDAHRARAAEAAEAPGGADEPPDAVVEPLVPFQLNGPNRPDAIQRMTEPAERQYR